MSESKILPADAEKFIKLIKGLSETEQMGVLMMLQGASILGNKKRTAIRHPPAEPHEPISAEN